MWFRDFSFSLSNSVAFLAFLALTSYKPSTNSPDISDCVRLGEHSLSVELLETRPGSRLQVNAEFGLEEHCPYEDVDIAVEVIISRLYGLATYVSHKQHISLSHEFPDYQIVQFKRIHPISSANTEYHGRVAGTGAIHYEVTSPESSHVSSSFRYITAWHPLVDPYD